MLSSGSRALSGPAGSVLGPGSRTETQQRVPFTRAVPRLCRPGPLGGSIVASRRLPYIYVQNWKCACSTVKATLWGAEHAMGLAVPPGYPHGYVEGMPFVNDPRRWEHVEREFVFTFVRNPYARALSAYLDQIVKNRNPEVWGPFAARHGLADAPLDFGDFLRLLAATPPEHMDPHWRPQYHSVAPDLVPYDFIGTLETFDRDIQAVMDRIFSGRVPIRAYAAHGTGSTERLAHYYRAEEVALVRRLYEVDFASLGYSDDPARVERRHAHPRADDRPIRAWGKACRLLGEREFAAAAAELERLRPSIAGPVIEESLVRCYGARPAPATDRALRTGVACIEQELARGLGDAETWKRYGQALTALGQREAGLEALVRAQAMRPPSPASERRLRRLQWRLAVLRASKGRRSSALAALPKAGCLPASGARNTIGRSRATAAEVARRGAIHLLAIGAAVTGARFWHPDRARRRGGQDQEPLQALAVDPLRGEPCELGGVARPHDGA
jgi:Sulfotransferase family